MKLHWDARSVAMRLKELQHKQLFWDSAEWFFRAMEHQENILVSRGPYCVWESELDWDARPAAAKIKNFVSAPQMRGMEWMVWLDHIKHHYPLAWSWFKQREDIQCHAL